MQKNKDMDGINNNQVTKECVRKLLFIGIVSTLILVALVLRLYYIQIVKHDIFTTEINKQKSINIPLRMYVLY